MISCFHTPQGIKKVINIFMKPTEYFYPVSTASLCHVNPDAIVNSLVPHTIGYL